MNLNQISTHLRIIWNRQSKHGNKLRFLSPNTVLMSNTSEFQLIHEKRGPLKQDRGKYTGQKWILPTSKQKRMVLTRKHGSFQCCLFSMLTQMKTIRFLFLPVSQIGSHTSLRNYTFSVFFPSFFLYFKRCCPISDRLASHSWPQGILLAQHAEQLEPRHSPAPQLSKTIQKALFYSTSDFSSSYIHIIKYIKLTGQVVVEMPLIPALRRQRKAALWVLSQPSLHRETLSGG